MSLQKEAWIKTCLRLKAARREGEHFIAELMAEDSLFVRINGSKVRQTGTVQDAILSLTWILETASGLKKASVAVTLASLSWQDDERVDQAIERLRKELPGLPVDPYAEIPVPEGRSDEETRGKLLSEGDVPEALLSTTSSLDLVGIYAGGPQIRALFTSAGTDHWFSTETFSFDFSIYTPNQKAVKSNYAGTAWDSSRYRSNVELARMQLGPLERPSVKVPRGQYRVYLGPSAVSDLLGMFQWGAVSESSIRQGGSCLRLLRQGERRFSPLFNLTEDFSLGLVPRFNDLGQISAETLPIIENGELKNSMISSRTGKEYGITPNGAGSSETLRAPRMAPGTLEKKDILGKLGDGLYLSNLHYLNWSDQTGGRITGMTRYACFQVKNGEIVAPIENMRWDESLFSFFGTSLEALTRETSVDPETGTYGMRHLGGVEVPGLLLSSMCFTL